MVHTVSRLADHKGNDGPKPYGDEYYIDVIVDITDYEVAGAVVTATECALSTINNATITGANCGTGLNVFVPRLELVSGGGYTSTEIANGNCASVTIKLITLDASDSSNDRFMFVPDSHGNAGEVRMRVWGNI